MNVVLHGSGTRFWNLGLARVRGSLTSEASLELAEVMLQKMDISLKHDVVAIMSDGPKVMVKLGKLVKPVLHQLCYAHGIQLAILDVLYKKENPAEATQPEESDQDMEDSSFDSNIESGSESELLDDETSFVSITSNRKETIDKIREIVKLCRWPLKKETLQKHVVADKDQEMDLILDCKTRWSSLAGMLERFCDLQTSIKKSLIDVGSTISLEEWEWDRTHELVNSLRPLQRVVEAICRRAATLITADASIGFILQQLHSQGTSISQELENSIRNRIPERRTLTAGVLKYLHTGKIVDDDDTDDLFLLPSRKEIVEFLQVLLLRISTALEENEAEAGANEVPEAASGDDGSSRPKKRRKRAVDDLQKELDSAIKAAIDYSHVEKGEQQPKSLVATLKQEMKLFENGNKRGYHLTLAYESLLGIKPTSVESERVFSTSGYFCSKIRSRLNDSTLDHLCYLRSYFKQPSD